MIGLNIKFLHYLEFKNDEIKSDIGNVGVIRRISDMVESLRNVSTIRR